MIFIWNTIKKQLSYTNSLLDIFNKCFSELLATYNTGFNPLYIIFRIFAVQVFKHWNWYYRGTFDFDRGSCKFEYLTDAQLQFGWI